MFYSCTNPIFWKNQVPEIQVKMLVANQIAGFLNQLYLQNKMIQWWWQKFVKIKSWLKNTRVGVVKNGCGHSNHRTPKLPVSEERSSGINWFFACSYKFEKAKSYRNNYWVGTIKNERVFLGRGTLKSAISQEWIDEWELIFCILIVMQ